MLIVMLYCGNMKRYNKTKSIEHNYYPIYTNNSFTNVNIEDTVNSMRNLQGFCACNNLASGRIAKLQGGYYFLTFDNKWERIGNSLREIPFKQLLNLKWK